MALNLYFNNFNAKLKLIKIIIIIKNNWNTNI